MKTFTLITLIMITFLTCNGQEKKHIWENLKNSTWEYDNNLNDTSKTFFENELGEKKVLFQIHDSEGRVTSSIINNYNCNENINISGKTKQIKVGNKFGWINPEFIKSKYFKVEDIDKYPTLINEEENTKLDKEEVLEVIVSFKNYYPFFLTEHTVKGGVNFSHGLEYFVESPKEFYGKKLYIFSDAEILENDILRKSKIKFRIQRKYLVGSYMNDDGTTTTYKAYIGAILENGEIKEIY